MVTEQEEKNALSVVCPNCCAAVGAKCTLKIINAAGSANQTYRHIPC